MKRINKNNLVKKISLYKPHIRWNWEKSLEGDKVRYFFVVVGERRDRERNLKSILECLNNYGGAIENIRKDSGKVFGTKFRYDFNIFDSRTSPEMIEWDNLSIPHSRDKNLYERIKKGCSIENYVADLYRK
jgi:hypothetical protein